MGSQDAQRALMAKLRQIGWIPEAAWFYYFVLTLFFLVNLIFRVQGQIDASQIVCSHSHMTLNWRSGVFECLQYRLFHISRTCSFKHVYCFLFFLYHRSCSEMVMLGKELSEMKWAWLPVVLFVFVLCFVSMFLILFLFSHKILSLYFLIDSSTDIGLQKGSVGEHYTV